MPVVAGDDELGQHRVERAADDVAGDDAGVEPDAGAGRRLEDGHDTGGGQEAAAGVLAVDPELEGVAGRGRVVVAEGLAVGDAELLADQVDAGDLLGDRVLDLQAGVDLEEGDGAVLADEELAGPGAGVAGLGQDRLGGADQLGVLLVGQERRGRLLDELLVAALQRAVAGGDDDDVAVGVGQALGLDVARLVEVALDEALAATERGDGLTGGRVEQLGDLLDGARDLQAATAAAVGRLDGHREAVLLGERDDLVGVVDRVGGAGHQRRVGAGGDVPGLDLVAEGVDRRGGGADPPQPGVHDGLGEGGVLGEEAVAGVDRVGAGLAGHLEQLLLHQVGVAGRGAAEGVGLVGDLDVQGVPVRIGIHRNRTDAAVCARPRDAHGDLATVGNEDLGDRLRRRLGDGRHAREPSPFPRRHPHPPGVASPTLSPPRLFRPSRQVTRRRTCCTRGIQSQAHDHSPEPPPVHRRRRPDRHPPARVRGVAGAGRRGRRGRRHGPRGRLPQHRHGRASTATRRASAAPSAATDLARDDLFVTTKVWNDDQGFDSTLAAFDASLGAARPRHPRPLPHPLADAREGQLRRHLEGAARSSATTAGCAPSASATSRSTTCSASTTRPVSSRPSTRSSCTPTSSRRAARLPRGQRDPHRGLEPARLRWRRPRRRRGPRHRREARRDTGPGDPALAPQLGNVVIPKSVTPSRIAENFDLFGFELDGDDLAAFAPLDRSERTGPDPVAFN